MALSWSLWGGWPGTLHHPSGTAPNLNEPTDPMVNPHQPICTQTPSLLPHNNLHFSSFVLCSSPQNDERNTNKPFIFLPFLDTSLFQGLSNCCVIRGTKIILVSKIGSKTEMQLFHLVTSSTFVLSCSYCQLSFPGVTLSCAHTLEAERQAQSVMRGQ